MKFKLLLLAWCWVGPGDARAGREGQAPGWKSWLQTSPGVWGSAEPSWATFFLPFVTKAQFLEGGGVPVGPWGQLLSDFGVWEGGGCPGASRLSGPQARSPYCPALCGGVFSAEELWARSHGHPSLRL